MSTIAPHALPRAAGRAALIEQIRSSLIGDDLVLEGAFGPRRLVYADYAASGESAADLVVIREDAHGGFDLEHLREELVRHSDRPFKIGTFSAASNVTVTSAQS